MSDYVTTPGKTTIAPDVLVTIARLTTLSVPGVSQMSPVPRDMTRFFYRYANEGVMINVENDTVYADIYVILHCDTSVREVCHEIQAKVARAISEMIGMEAGRVNVHVEDIDYSIKNRTPYETTNQGA